jgi:hypothetical protein
MQSFSAEYSSLVLWLINNLESANNQLAEEGEWTRVISQFLVKGRAGAVAIAHQYGIIGVAGYSQKLAAS